MGATRCRTSPTRADHWMDPAALKWRLLSDRAEGHVRFLCVASVGTTSSHAVDPVAEIGPACNSCGTWLHVDAAHLGIAALCPELRGIHSGLEFAERYQSPIHT